MDSTLSSIDLDSSLQHDFNDPSLQNAIREAKNTKTITPLVKQELKYTILSRRSRAGKGEIVLLEDKPAIKQELTEEERKKKLRRKDQNRRAAQRCREKKKNNSEKVITDYIVEKNKTEALQKEIEELKKEKEQLQRTLDDHTCMYPVTPNQTPSYDDRTSFTFPPFNACPTPCTFVNQFDEVFSGVSHYMYPAAPDMMSQKLHLPPSCTITSAELPELDIPEDFQVYQPCSPEMLGRQSISDYHDIDHDYMEEDIDIFL